MGTNYYLKPRGYDELKIINQTTNLFLKGLLQTYRDELNKMIEKSDSFCPIYSEILDRADLDNINIKLELINIRISCQDKLIKAILFELIVEIQDNERSD